MNLLVCGAGVIGSYFTHVLCSQGHAVSLLARGRRRAELEERGLVIRHYLQRKTTVDCPRVVGAVDEGGPYDAVFAVMQYQQLESILPDLAAADCPLVVLVGNNPAAPRMAEYIWAHSTAPKEVLFGFQATGGRREDGKIVCVRFSAGALACGGAREGASQSARALIDGLFTGSEYRAEWFDSMDAVYISHLAFILPISYLCYACGCDLRKITRSQLRQGMEAVREGYALLSALGVPILPEGSEAPFQPGPGHGKMLLKLWLMAKTPIGRLAASDHCRNSPGEMEALDAAFETLREKRRDFSMPCWDALRAAMPSWARIREAYAR